MRRHLLSRVLGLLLSILAVMSQTARADVDSGPTVGEKMPALALPVVVGANMGNDTDWLKERGDKPTVYFFVRMDKFSRTTARIMKKFDTELVQLGEVKAVAVWLTDNKDETTKRLPLIQQSLSFDHTTLCLLDKNQDGPEGWGVNSDADLTAVVIVDGKVAKRFGWVGPNETVVKDLIAALPKK